MSVQAGVENHFEKQDRKINRLFSLISATTQQRNSQFRTKIINFSRKKDKLNFISYIKAGIGTKAETKMQDLNAFTIESAMKMVAGTARSMGFTVSGGESPF